MNTIQLHVDPSLDGSHGVRVYHVTPPARLGELDQQRYVGKLDLPPWLVQRLQQLTPLAESLIDGARIAWTGVPLEQLPPEPLLGKFTKLLRGMKRVVLGA